MCAVCIHSVDSKEKFALLKIKNSNKCLNKTHNHNKEKSIYVHSKLPVSVNVSVYGGLSLYISALL